MSSTFSSTSRNNGTVFINGKVYTVNDAQPLAEAFIVGPDGVFQAVGTTSEIEATARKDHMTIYDLRGHFVMPGLHDAHVHLLMSSIAASSEIRLPETGLNMYNLAEELKKGQCLQIYSRP
jgi:predicted amidohydrolase YtcJ